MRYLHEQPDLETSLESLVQSYTDMLPLLNASGADGERSIRLLMQNDADQFLRRVAIRSSLASIEGTVHALKQIEVKMLQIFPLQLSANQKDNLTKSWGVPAFQNIKTCLTVLARFAHGPHAEVASDSEWSSFESVVRLRHRITHPKTVKDLDISDEELAEFLKCIRMFLDRMGTLIVHLSESLSAKVKERMIYHRVTPRVGRNEQCTCGSGKKYKYCCGRGDRTHIQNDSIKT